MYEMGVDKTGGGLCYNVLDGNNAAFTKDKKL